MKFATTSSIPARVALFLALALWLLGSAPDALARRNLVYINGNITTSGQNVVIALQNDGAGNMTPVPGSPFATGGTGVAGTGDPLEDAQWDSDGELAVNSTATLLYVVNGHSNDFSAFNLNADGTLTLIPGSPFPSGGTQPASIGYLDGAAGNGISTMVVANKDSDPFQTPTAPNYTTFQVDATGVPTMNPGSTLTLPTGTSPSQILIPKKARREILAIQFLGKNVSSYSLTRRGIITSTSSLDIVGTPVGGVLHPTLRNLYLTVASKDRLSVLTYDQDFNLSLLKTLSSPGDAPCWATTNKAGTRLYTGETLSGSVTIYDITDASSPVQLQHLVLSGAMPFATHTHLDVTEKFLYVLDRQGVLHVLDVAADGTVSETREPFNLGLPIGTVPLGVVVVSK